MPSHILAKKSRKVGSIMSARSRKSVTILRGVQEDDSVDLSGTFNPRDEMSDLPRTVGILKLRPSLNTFLKEEGRKKEEEDDKISADNEDPAQTDPNYEDTEDEIDQIRDSFSHSARFLQKTDSPVQDFFVTLGEMPSITDISSDRSEIIEDIDDLKKSSFFLAQSDVGTFVDPLTGSVLTSSSSKIDVKTGMLENEISIHHLEEPNIESNIDLLEEVMIEDDPDLEKEEIQMNFKEDTKKHHDFDLVHFFTVPLSKTEGITIIKSAISQEYWQQFQADILEFINRLVNNVVNLLEHKDSDRVLRETLDKEKLMDKLIENLKNLDVEKKVNKYLNKSIIEHLRRKGNYRYLKEDAPEQIMDLIDKDMGHKEKLSKLLYEEQQLEYDTFQKVSKLEALLKQEENVANQSIENLEKIIQNSLNQKSFNHLNEFVSQSLKQMSITRDEISRQRFLYIDKIDTLSTLLEKESELDKIGENITMRNYEQLSAETITLSKKCDERTQELDHFNHKCNYYVNKISHIKDITKALRNKLEIKKSALNDLLTEKDQARKELGYHKRMRQNLRKEFGTIQLQGGLAGSEALLMDYDETANQIQKMKASIDQLKQKHRHLELRHSTLKNKCTSLKNSIV